MSRGGGIFVGLMFLGLGIGMLFNRADAGILIGMGVGFIAAEIYKRVYTGEERVETEEAPYIRGTWILGLSLTKILLGALFIGLGLVLIISPEILALFFEKYGEYLGAIVLIIIGLAFLFSGLSKR